jgi:DNA modification methylase
MTNALYYGDNLDVLRHEIAGDSVDLIYLDPPFNSQANYNVLFKSPTGKAADAQIEAFEDTWHWGEQAERAFSEVLASPATQAAELLRAMRSFLGENDMMAYLAMMAVRLIELHRVLKPTGSLYLHCDPTASHYLKLLLDGIFSPQCFRTEIIWKRNSAHSDGKQGRKQHGRIHDVIFFYSKSLENKWHPIYTDYGDKYVKSHYSLIDPESGRRFRAGDLTAAKPGGDTSYEWRIKRPAGNAKQWQADLNDEYQNPRSGWDYEAIRPYQGRYWAYSRANMEAFERAGRIYYPSSGLPNYKRFLDEMEGIPLQDLWTDIAPINSQAQERLGYPTQKPVALLERIIFASSSEGDLVLDPFCGCGTTIHAAQKLGRAWIGIDITHLAISLIERRLKDAFPGVAFEVHGTPKDLASALDLAARDKYQFQWWAVSLVDARPYGGKKKGADGGIDGILFFRSDKDKTEKALVSVKGGENVGVGMVRDLIAVVEREKAAVGVLISLAMPTRAMEREAAAAGLFEGPFESVPKIQIITLAELFQGIRPRIPRIDVAATFRTAAREATGAQGRLL